MIFDSLVEKRQSLESPSTSLADPAVWLFESFGATPTAAGQSVSETTALRLSAVWACVNIISESLGELPLALFERTDEGKEIKREDRRHKLVSQQPNEEMTAINWRALVESHVLTWGNGYSWIRRLAGKPVELIPLLPDVTKPKRIGGEIFFETRITIAGETERLRIPAEDVLHVPGLGFDGLVGWSPVRVQREMLGAAMAAQDFSSRFWGNSAQTAGVIEFPGTVTDKDQLRSEWQKGFSGSKALRTAVLDKGAKYTRIGIPPEDAQFLQTRNFQVEEIARMFRVPLQFLAKMGEATYNNAEQMGIFFVQYTLMPWLVRWEQELNRKLLTPAERARLFFKFNVNGLLRGSTKDRFESYNKAILDGWLTRNEVRELEDRNTLEGLDDPLIPMNTMVVGAEPLAPGTAQMVVNVVRSAVRRLMRMEINAIKTAYTKTDGDEALRQRINQFYDKHAAVVVESLGLPTAAAMAYVKMHRSQALEQADARTGFFDPVFELWENQHADEMVEAIVSGDRDGTDSTVPRLSKG